MSRKTFEKLWSATTLALILAMLVAPLANAQVWTDQADYAPGSVVTISGDNSTMQNGQLPYVDGNAVSVSVLGPNGWTSACNATVAGGAWSCQVTLSSDPAIAVGPYTYTATSLAADGITPIVETGTFTDSRTITSATITKDLITVPTDATSLTVSSSATIAAIVNVTTDNSG